MALNIRHPEAEMLAADLARLTGETKTAAVTRALREQLSRVRRDRSGMGLADRLVAIGKECAALPVLDDRAPEEILGYDEDGLPGR
ncbi:MAG: type II toxin-antitoxin system VapB family antitoxin [Gammaproteobacteria bacterium]|nr:type II toxin-antitoxin system VapB family antitoxin [Gammaproteobacteria bacterium]